MDVQRHYFSWRSRSSCSSLARSLEARGRHTKSPSQPPKQSWASHTAPGQGYQRTATDLGDLCWVTHFDWTIDGHFGEGIATGSGVWEMNHADEPLATCFVAVRGQMRLACVCSPHHRTVHAHYLHDSCKTVQGNGRMAPKTSTKANAETQAEHACHSRHTDPPVSERGTTSAVTPMIPIWAATAVPVSRPGARTAVAAAAHCCTHWEPLTKPLKPCFGYMLRLKSMDGYVYLLLFNAFGDWCRCGGRLRGWNRKSSVCPTGRW